MGPATFIFCEGPVTVGCGSVESDLSISCALSKRLEGALSRVCSSSSSEGDGV